MSPEKTRQLLDKFPELYRGTDEPITQNLMSFGFECGDGWFDLLMELSQGIDEIAKAHNLTGDDYPKVLQVKEKFGELRFYVVDDSIREIESLVQKAEERSRETCEKCGDPGTQTNSGWISTLCEECKTGAK